MEESYFHLKINNLKYCNCCNLKVFPHADAVIRADFSLINFILVMIDINQNNIS